MQRSVTPLVFLGLLSLPLSAAAQSVTLTPIQTTVATTQTQELTAVVTGTTQKSVKFKVCDGNGKNCVRGGSSTLGTIAQIGTDSSSNPIARYTAPAMLPPAASCPAVATGCQVKIKAVLKVGQAKFKSFATVTLTAPGVTSSPTGGGNGNSRAPARSATGRFVAFSSVASNLVAGDTNGRFDVFVRDTCVGAPTGCSPSTTRVSVASDGTQANGSSFAPSISAHGRFVSFTSAANNLVAGDTNAVFDLFVRDTCVGAGGPCTPTTTRVSVANDGSEANFGFTDTVTRPPISADGRFVVFDSFATNLVPNDTNGTFDIFLRDTCVGVPAGCSPSTTRVSVASDGSQGNERSFRPSLSADGRFVAFESLATNLVAGDTNGEFDIFVRDTCLGVSGPCTPTTTRVSVANDGSEGGGSGRAALSADGRFVAFQSFASNFVPGDSNGAEDLFVHDTCIGARPGCTPSTVRVSVANDGTEANGQSFGDSLSADGRFVAFASDASNLVPGDTNGFFDVFVRDTCVGAGAGCTPSTVRASVALDGSEANGPTLDGSLSPDGRFVSMGTFATNLLIGDSDTNQVDDVYGGRTSFVRPPLAYVASIGSPNIGVFETGTNTFVTGFDLSTAEAVSVAITPDGLRGYVGHQNSDQVSVINLLSNTFIGSVTVGAGAFKSPQGLAITPDGTQVYATDEGSSSVSVIDTGTNTVIATIGVGANPLGVALTPDGKRAYVNNSGSNNVSVIDTDPASGTFHTVVATISVGTAPEGIAISPDGTRAYVANEGSNNVSVINTSTNAVVATIAVGSAPTGVAVTPDGTRVYVANFGTNNVSVINTATNSVVATIAVVLNPLLIAIAPEGPTAYVTNDNTDKVSVINVASNTVVATVTVGPAPAGIALRLVR